VAGLQFVRMVKVLQQDFEGTSDWCQEYFPAAVWWPWRCCCYYFAFCAVWFLPSSELELTVRFGAYLHVATGLGQFFMAQPIQRDCRLTDHTELHTCLPLTGT